MTPNMTPNNTTSDFQYHIKTWAVDNGDNTFSFTTTVPQYYTLKKLTSGTVDPKTGDGSFTLDDNIYQRTTGTSSIGGGFGVVQFTVGRDAMVIQTLLDTSGGAILPSSYTDSKGILYVVAPAPPSWLETILEAQSPSALGLQKVPPVAVSYYQPAETQLQICNPSLLPNLQKILVYNGPRETYITYVQTAHNKLFSFKNIWPNLKAIWSSIRHPSLDPYY